jgi:hypothetical protein
MFELLAQARDQPVDVVKRAPYGSCILTPAQLEKYTKLIVQVCWCKTNTSHCANVSKEHFGVEQ